MLERRGIDSPDTAVAIGLAAICLLCFAPVVFFDFFVMDDPLYLTHNPVVRDGLTLRGMWVVLTDPFSVQLWMPVSLYSHMLDVELFGMNAGAHHAVNLIIHTINTLLVYLVFRRITGVRPASGLVAALFAIHPLHVEPVVWIASRKDLLSCLFFLLALILYHRYVRMPTRLRLLGISAVLVLAVSSKTIALTLPFVMLILDYWPLRRAPDLSARNAAEQWLRVVREKWVLFLISAGTIAISMYASRGSTAAGSFTHYSFIERIKNMLVGYVTYVVQTVWPVNLIPYYFHDVQGTPSWLAAVCAVILAGFSTFAIWKRKAFPYLLAGWLWYGITLGPVSGIVEIASHSHADRYAYIPLIGLFTMAAWSLRDIVRSFPSVRRPIAVVTGIVLLVLTGLSFIQVQRWRDNETLLRYALEVEPRNPKLREVLGSILREQGKLDGAIAEFELAVDIVPDSPGLLLRLAECLMAANRNKDAEEVLDRLLTLKPESPVANLHMARNEIALGKFAAARERMQRILAVQPNNSEAWAILRQLEAPRSADTWPQRP